MPAYDATDFRPPAPVALVTVRSSVGAASVSNVPMLLDSGADVSLLPRDAVASLIENEQSAAQYELEAFDGTTSVAPAFALELLFLGKVFRGQFLVVEGRHGILGRNILNAVSLLLDGPSLIWTENR
jgi:hypothetical protein